MSGNKFPKIGIALGSGGAKGIAHIGVLKVLNKHTIPIDYIAGTSIGAIIGSLYASHGDVKKLEDTILNFSKRSGFTLIDFTVKGGLFKGIKTEKFLAEILEDAKFDTLKIPFAAVATDINTAESLILREGNLVKAVRASASVPAFYQPLLYKGRILADGGLSNPVPVDVITSMGADVTIAINLDTFYLEKLLEEMPALSKVPVHSINILRHNLARHSVKNADVIISPRDLYKTGFIGWSFFFDSAKTKKIIEEGERVTEEAIPQIKKAIKEWQYHQTRRGKFFSFFKKLKRRGKAVSFNA